ncbi:hypothetical protein ES692_00560 [Psychroserpens burtonensis]|uniref:DUF5025 domain-containing protein n=1 Tax=Psychroserpens burtonensis TaxID=49278 RepID=A0A5C7BBX2_9FLAO|nr:hypothetical protein [Psychroserpens burtonensis]TXE20315.1 hypothetical protein ES692_00560 [Psychroserpens burtonensis]
MKTAKLFLVILIAIAIQSCSSDSDIDPEPTIDNRNGIHYKGVFYPLNTAIIRKKEFNVWNRGPSVYIRLFNADPLFNADDPFITHPKWLDINKFSFFYEATEVTTRTITPVPHYNMRINTGYDPSNIHLATTILRDYTVRPENIAVASIVHINAISADEIDLDFEFTRPDGEIITGRYKGSYSDVSTED